MALVPACFRLWWGRSFARLVDDPTLPERLMAGRRRTMIVLASTFALLLGMLPTDLPGGVLANPAALPARPRSAVLVTDTVPRFDPDEVVAIGAHELAHLEHYNPRRVRGMNAVNLTLIAVAASIVPLMRWLDPR